MNTTDKNNSIFYKEGVRDWESGIGTDGCSYGKESHAAAEWVWGWNDRQALYARVQAASPLCHSARKVLDKARLTLDLEAATRRQVYWNRRVSEIQTELEGALS